MPAYNARELEMAATKIAPSGSTSPSCRTSPAVLMIAMPTISASSSVSVISAGRAGGLGYRPATQRGSWRGVRETATGANNETCCSRTIPHRLHPMSLPRLGDRSSRRVHSRIRARAAKPTVSTAETMERIAELLMPDSLGAPPETAQT